MIFKELLSKLDELVNKKVNVTGYLYIDPEHPKEFSIIEDPEIVNTRISFLEFDKPNLESKITIFDFWAKLPKTVLDRMPLNKIKMIFGLLDQSMDTHIIEFIDKGVDSYLSQYLETIESPKIRSVTHELYINFIMGFIKPNVEITVTGKLIQLHSGEWRITDIENIVIGKDNYIEISREKPMLNNIKTKFIGDTEVINASSFLYEDEGNLDTVRTISGLLLGTGMRNIGANFFIVPNYTYTLLQNPHKYGIYLKSKSLTSFILKHQDSILGGHQLHKDRKVFRSTHKNNIVVRGFLKTSTIKRFKYEMDDISEASFQVGHTIFNHVV